jgi:hypothetical protein
MKRMILTTKFFGAMAAVSLISLIAISNTGNSLGSNQSAIYKMASGINICFQRVNQTFTALMLKDLSSDFIKNDFKNTTGECFSQLSAALGGVLSADSEVNTQMNNLISDVHWFGQKATRVAKLAKDDGIDLFQSNIIGKYEQLESLKMDIEEGILTSADNINKSKTLAMVAMILSQLTLLFSIIGLFMKKKLVSKGMADVEKLVANSETKIEDHILSEKALKRLFGALDIPKTESFILKYFNTIIEENYRIKDHLIKANTLGERFEISELESDSTKMSTELQAEDCDFNHSLNTVIERVKEKAFNHGIIIDVNVKDQFHIKSNKEALDQFLFYMLSFAMDSSLDHNQGRKVIITGKPLGGIAYCKVKISGHAFTNEEFAIINGKEPERDTNIHLVLLKELIADSSARLAVKNKNNPSGGTVESEMEIIFDRSQISAETAKPSRINVLKGTKKELAKFFQNSEPTA